MQSVLDENADYLPLTVRQVFYRLVGAYGYDKTEAAYTRLCEHLVRARRAGLVPFEALRDDGASVIADHCFADAADFWDDTAKRMRGYRRDRQRGQGVYVELWCEAAGMMPQLARVTRDYSVPVYSCGGFASLSAVRQIVDRACARDVPTVLLHVGDFDPSGESIFEAMTADAGAFLERDRVICTQRLDASRVALTAQQVADFSLPTSPPKASDSRSSAWRDATCQLEALAPGALAQIVRDSIERHLDLLLLDEVAEHERRDRIDLLRALPAGAA